MTHVSDGQRAESVAAQYMQNHGFAIIEQNWRTRYCEIDIVAQKNTTVYFVEVKYRRTNHQGSGLDYITPKKLQQMQFAAELWTAKHNWQGDLQLAAVEVSGLDYDVTEFVLL